MSLELIKFMYADRLNKIITNILININQNFKFLIFEIYFVIFSCQSNFFLLHIKFINVVDSQQFN